MWFLRNLKVEVNFNFILKDGQEWKGTEYGLWSILTALEHMILSNGTFFSVKWELSRLKVDTSGAKCLAAMFKTVETDEEKETVL